MITASDVVELVAMMRAANIEVWVDGGWCVDALIGEQTRDHDDLDIAVPIEHDADLRALMTGAGFTLLRADGPFNCVLADGNGRRVDVHLFDRSTTAVNADGVEVFGGIAYPIDAFGASGTIAGRAVPCCTGEFLMYAHTCYEPDEDDVADMRALHAATGTPLLPPFTPR